MGYSIVIYLSFCLLSLHEETKYFHLKLILAVSRINLYFCISKPGIAAQSKRDDEVAQGAERWSEQRS